VLIMWAVGLLTDCRLASRAPFKSDAYDPNQMSANMGSPLKCQVISRRGLGSFLRPPGIQSQPNDRNSNTVQNPRIQPQSRGKQQGGVPEVKVRRSQFPWETLSRRVYRPLTQQSMAAVAVAWFYFGWVAQRRLAPANKHLVTPLLRPCVTLYHCFP
jgi:hypothetical protein